MSGLNGTKYVTLLDDKANHLLDADEQTVCGLPIPINGGASWTYAVPDKVCPKCSKADEPEPEPVVDEPVVEEPEPPKAKKK